MAAAKGRIGYFASGGHEVGVNNIAEVATTDDFLFVLPGLGDLIAKLNTPHGVAYSDAYDMSGGKSSPYYNFPQYLPTNMHNGTGVPGPNWIGRPDGFSQLKTPDVYNHLKIKCQNAVIPGVTSTTYDANMHGFNMKYRGKRDYSRSLSITYLEDMKMGTSKIFLAWAELMCGTFVGTGHDFDYRVDALLYVFPPNSKLEKDKANKKPSMMYVFRDAFPTNVQELSLNGGNSESAKFSITFAYDIAAISEDHYTKKPFAHVR